MELTWLTVLASLARGPGEPRTTEPIGQRKLLAWFSSVELFGSATLAALSDLIFFKPRVTYGQPQTFQIGKPDKYPPGVRIARETEKICIVQSRRHLDHLHAHQL